MDPVDSLVLGSKNYGTNLNFLRNVEEGKAQHPILLPGSKKSGVDRLINGIRIVSADRFLCGLI